MRPPCEIVVRYILPGLRSLVAKKLVEKYSFTQVAAAKKLGTTQAAISHYLYSKRGEKRIKELETNEAVKSVIDDVTVGIATGKYGPVDIVSKLCGLCEALMSGDLIYVMQREQSSLPDSCGARPDTT